MMMIYKAKENEKEEGYLELETELIIDSNEDTTKTISWFLKKFFEIIIWIILIIFIISRIIGVIITFHVFKN